MTHSSVKTEAASPDDQLGLYARSSGRLPNAAATSSSVPAVLQPETLQAVIGIITSLLLSD